MDNLLYCSLVSINRLGLQNINIILHLLSYVTMVQAPLKVISHSLYGMNNFVTNKSKLPQIGAQVFPYMG